MELEKLISSHIPDQYLFFMILAHKFYCDVVRAGAAQAPANKRIKTTPGFVYISNVFFG
jgi:hypothetical protein